MKINLPARYLILGVVGGTLVAPTTVLAQESRLDRSKPWATDCEAAVTTRLISDYPHVGQVIFSRDNAYQYQVSNAETGVHGTAESIGSGAAKTRHQLTFSCVYNIRRGEVSDVNYDITDVNY